MAVTNTVHNNHYFSSTPGKQEENDDSSFDYIDTASVQTADSFGGIWRLRALDDSRFVGACYDRCGRLWSSFPDQEIKQARILKNQHQKEVLCVAKLSQAVFLTGSSDGVLCYWDQSGKAADSFKERINDGFYSLAILDETTIATGSCARASSGNRKPVIKIWDIAKQKFLLPLYGHNGGISGLTSLKENILASVSEDKTLKIWNIHHKKMIASYKNHVGYIYSLAKFNDESVVTGGRDRKIHVCDVESGTIIQSLQESDGNAHASTVYDINTLNQFVTLSASRDGYVKIWDRRLSGSVQTLSTEDGFVYSADFTPNGKVIAGTSGVSKQIFSHQKREIKKPLIQDAHFFIWDIKK